MGLTDLITNTYKYFTSHHVFTLALIILIIFIIIHIIYFNVSPESFGIDPEKDFSEKSVDAIYFTFTTFSTVGYGDILPLTSAAKMLVGLEHLLVLYLTFGVVGQAVEKTLTASTGECRSFDGICSNIIQNQRQEKTVNAAKNKFLDSVRSPKRKVAIDEGSDSFQY